MFLFFMVLKLIINQNYNKNYLNINNFVIFIKFITSGTPRAPGNKSGVLMGFKGFLQISPPPLGGLFLWGYFFDCYKEVIVEVCA